MCLRSIQNPVESYKWGEATRHRVMAWVVLGSCLGRTWVGNYRCMPIAGEAQQLLLLRLIERVVVSFHNRLSFLPR